MTLANKQKPPPALATPGTAKGAVNFGERTAPLYYQNMEVKSMAKSKSRGAQGAGSIRQRPDGRWEARYVVGRDSTTGKQIRRSVYGSTQREVRQKLSKAVSAIDEGNYFEPTKMTLARWAEIWLSEYSGDKKYSTIKHYKAQCKSHIIPMLGNTKLSELTAPQVQKFYNDLQRNGLAAKSVRNIHGILTKCLSTAVKVGYIKYNPCSGVTLPRVEKKEIHPLTDKQVKAFLQEADKDEYSYLLKTILFTGLREGEAIGLTWDVIDFDAGTIKVCKQLQKRPIADGGFVFAPLKNNKTRILKPAPFVMSMLKERRLEDIENRLKAGPMWKGWQNEKEHETAIVFSSSLGEHLHPQTVVRHYKKIVTSLGIPESRVHDLRHRFAVLSLQNGDDVKTVQGNLGHATAAFTLDVYGHVSEKMKDESASRMEQYIKGLENL